MAACDGRRIAGISAFGVGGVNAHLVLEEGPVAASETSARSAQLLCVSTRTEAALDTALGNLGRRLGEHPESNFADVAHTLQTGRHGFRSSRFNSLLERRRSCTRAG